MLRTMHLMVVLVTLNRGCGKSYKPSMLAIFSTTMVSISLFGKEIPPRSLVAPGRSFALIRP